METRGLSAVALHARDEGAVLANLNRRVLGVSFQPLLRHFDSAAVLDDRRNNDGQGSVWLAWEMMTFARSFQGLDAGSNALRPSWFCKVADTVSGAP